MAKVKRKRLANMSRPEFLFFLENEKSLPSVVRRRVQEGRCELLGLFAGWEPTWVVEVCGMRQPKYIHIRESRAGTTVLLREWQPPWGDWIGDRAAATPLNLGDRPEAYAGYGRMQSE
jgi:hypothetical protein